MAMEKKTRILEILQTARAPKHGCKDPRAQSSVVSREFQTRWDASLESLNSPVENV